MTDDDRPPLDERLTTERAMRTGVPEGTIAFPDSMPEPVDLALDALDAAGGLTEFHHPRPADSGEMKRPTLTVSAAADATGKSRRTIGRLLDAGRLDGAEQDETGTWHIPVDALIAAGLTLHAPSLPDEALTDDPAPAPPPPAALDALRAEVADWRRRAEVAEAVAAERAAALDDVRQALAMANRMLTSGAPTPPPATEAASSPASSPRRRWWKR
jgi:hypothetical protein